MSEQYWTSEQWIGVDFDGTLVTYGEWKGASHVGDPIIPMLDRVKEWVAKGIRVKIFTARVSHTADAPVARKAIKDFCVAQGLPELEVTCIKDYQMQTLWDDRAVHVVTNTGEAYGTCRASGFSNV